MTPGQIASYKAACAEYDGTLTGQQQAAAVLARILAVPGLPDATWTVYQPGACASIPEIVGQVHSGAIAAARSAIDAYALALELYFDDEKHLAATDYCAAFTHIGAHGVIDGVDVKVWCAGREVTR